MKNLIITFAMVALSAIGINAQIGYQVAVMDQATGEPKSNKTVSVEIVLTDNSGTVIYSTSTSSTTNDFGVISLQIGTSTTFENMDWSNLPLWVSATVDGVSVGKMQVLNVPVAEHAKHYGVLTPELLTGKTVTYEGLNQRMIFGANTATLITHSGKSYSYNYEIDGNNVYVIRGECSCWAFYYSPKTGIIYDYYSSYEY